MPHGARAFFIYPALLFALIALFYRPAALAAGNPEAGKKIFNGICINCHGDEGVTEVPGVPVFANGERMDKSDEQLKHSIRNGVNNPDNPAGMSMPPFGGGPPLDDKQLSDVISYERTLRGLRKK